MQDRKFSPLLFMIINLVFASLACSSLAPESTPTPEATDTPVPTAAITATPTNTPRPSPTLRPSKTPDLAATQLMDELNAEAQKYLDLGYLPTINGRFVEYDDFEKEWAQLGWYNRWNLRESARNFFMRAHF